jgi:uncharacterized protein YjiS (DUF1127 family)
MIKKLFWAVIRHIEYGRMIQVLSSMSDRQLKDIGVPRSQIMEVAKRSVYK